MRVCVFMTGKLRQDLAKMRQLCDLLVEKVATVAACVPVFLYLLHTEYQNTQYKLHSDPFGK